MVSKQGKHIRGLTIIQPWASYLADGEKQYETRSWAIGYRGLIAIHAGKSREFIDRSSSYPLGVILAVASLDHIIPTNRLTKGMEISHQERQLGDWSADRFAWKLTQVVKLPKPIEHRGKQGLWFVRQEVAEELMSYWLENA